MDAHVVGSIVHGTRFELSPSCGKNDGGHWFCVACNEAESNNFAANTHADEGHTLIWVCHEHGPEES